MDKLIQVHYILLIRFFLFLSLIIFFLYLFLLMLIFLQVTYFFFLLQLLQYLIILINFNSQVSQIQPSRPPPMDAMARGLLDL